MNRKEAKEMVVSHVASGAKIDGGVIIMEELIDKIFDEHETQMEEIVNLYSKVILQNRNLKADCDTLLRALRKAVGQE